MKKRAIVLILVGLLCLTSIVFAQVSETYDLSWNVIGGGGGPMGSANYAMRSTVGQAAFGYSFSDNYGLGTGYWYGITEFKPGLTPVHNIDTGENFSRIQAAIDDSNTLDGHTITVDPGTYNENVVVNKQLTIKSTSGNPADTIVQAANSNDHVFNVKAGYVNISGFTVQNATGSQAGIYLGTEVDHCNISSNNATNNYNGIVLLESSNNTLMNNTASNNNYDGIVLWRGNNNTLTGNTANSNNGYASILLYSSSNNNLTGNTANSNNNHASIKLEYSSNNNTLTNNIANSNNNIGIFLEHSSSNNLTNNTANSNNAYGIFLASSSNNNLTNNTANSNALIGIYLFISSNYNMLTSNTVSHGGIGIYLRDSSNNLIYNNYFNNTDNAYDDGTNVWNITKTAGTNIIGGPYLGGNYWSDYTGEDTDGDGLGDTPYDISRGKNKDYLPLVEFVPLKPTVSISTDKYEYALGDTMITTIGLKNPTADSINTYFIWYFGLPEYGYGKQIVVTPLTLPASFDESYEIPIDIGDWGAVGFDATWYVALLNTAAPYEIISQDTADWRYAPRAASTAEQEQEITLTPEEIATEIMETVEIETVEVELAGKKQGETVPVEIVEEIAKEIT